MSNKSSSPQARNALRVAQGASVGRPIRDIIKLGCYTDHNGNGARVREAIQHSVSHVTVVEAVTTAQPGNSNTEFAFRQQLAPTAAFSETGRVGIVLSTKNRSSDILFGSRDPDNAEAALLRNSTFDAVHRTSTTHEWRHNHAATTCLVAPEVCLIHDLSGRLVQPRPVTVALVQSSEGLTAALHGLQQAGVTTLVLDPCNTDADTWATLLALNDAPFHGVFDRVVFAIPGSRYETFSDTLDAHLYAQELDDFLLSEDQSFIAL